MAALTVGLTGGLASGKSTVGRQFAAAGFTVVDADELVAALYRTGQPGAAAVEALFGRELLTPDGSVDKPTLARRVFSDPSARASLEKAVHPLVGERFRQVARATDGIAVLEATKLIEAGLADELDVVLTVEAPTTIRLQRAERRGLSPDDARRRIAAQASEQERRSGAHLVIENSGSREALAVRVAEVVGELRQRAGLEPESHQ